MSETKFIEGLPEVYAALQKLPAEIEAKVVRFALRAGANVIKQAAIANAPIRSGLLKSTIKASAKRVANGEVVVSVKAGSRQKGGGGAFYAHMVEFGTKPHQIRSRTGKILVIGFSGITRKVMHPGSPPKPFMHRALTYRDAAYDQIVIEATKRMKTAVRRAAKAKP